MTTEEQRKYCPDCGSLLPDESHEIWCFCKPIEQRAEAAEAERDEARRQLTEAQHAIDVLSNTVVAQNNEITRLRQKREDVAEYRAEIERLNQAATA